MNAPNDLDFLENQPYDSLTLGQTATLTRTLTSADIGAFAALSGDVNPAHLDADYAQSTRFHGVIGHGMWGASLISALLGTQLPGPGSIYLEQSLQFLRPVRVGDQVCARVTVVAKDDTHHTVELDCELRNQHDERVISGRARVLAPTQKLRRPRPALPRLQLAPADAPLQ